MNPYILSVLIAIPALSGLGKNILDENKGPVNPVAAVLLVWAVLTVVGRVVCAIYP